MSKECIHLFGPLCILLRALRNLLSPPSYALKVQALQSFEMLNFCHITRLHWIWKLFNAQPQIILVSWSQNVTCRFSDLSRNVA